VVLLPLFGGWTAHMSMTVILLALTAAVLHATWNAFLRSGADRLWVLTVMSFAGTLVSIPLVILLPIPSAEAWPYILLSALFQTGYGFFLVAAYRYGQLGQVYPIVRGTAPLLVMLGAFLLTGIVPSQLQIVGVAIIAVGIMSLAFARGGASTSSILLAFATGLFVASYQTADAIGVRFAENAIAYSAWGNICFGIFLPLCVLAVRRQFSVDWNNRETHKALFGGAISMVSYTLVIIAFSIGSAGPVSALRETSVVFAVLIGWLFLGEKLNAWRILSAVIVAIGAICLGLAR
jgi:drug/metabolite transporter (DMT)-like permease